MSARRLRAAGTLVAGLALLALVAWQSGAKAVHYASDPTHEPCPALTPGDHTLTVDTPQGRRQVVLHAPRDAYKPRPLVIAWHGAGQTAAEFASSTGLSRLADRAHFLVAYSPSEGRGDSWNTGALDQVEAAACVDPARVFVTGVSNGGGPAARLACDLPGRLAGVAAVAGGHRPLRQCTPDRPLPVLEIHGTAEQAVPYGGRLPASRAGVTRWLGQWRRIDGCHGRADRLKLAPGVTEVAWRRCSAATRVVLMRLGRRTHGWRREPRTQPLPAPFAATWRAWQFFRTLPPRPPLQTA
jgi:polyhydroxybutyrate depolymerase